MQKEKKELPWKPKPSPPAMDPKIYRAYVNASGDPFPHNSSLLREILKALLKHCSVPVRQQILQRLQMISGCERDKSIRAEVREEVIRETIENLSAFTPLGKKSRAHDKALLIRQKADLRALIDKKSNPYPKNDKERIVWLTKNASAMWNKVIAEPCFCDYARWSSEIVSELQDSSPNDVIEKILAAIHGMSTDALHKSISPKRIPPEAKEWRGPRILENLTKEEVQRTIRGYAFKAKPSIANDGSIEEYECQSGQTIKINVDGHIFTAVAKKVIVRREKPVHSSEPTSRKINNTKQQKPLRTLKFR